MTSTNMQKKVIGRELCGDNTKNRTFDSVLGIILAYLQTERSAMETQNTTLTNEHLSLLLEQAQKKGTEEGVTMSEMINWLVGKLKK